MNLENKKTFALFSAVRESASQTERYPGVNMSAVLKNATRYWDILTAIFLSIIFFYMQTLKNF